MFYSLSTLPVRSSKGFHRNHAPVVSNGALDRFLNDTFSSLQDAGPGRAASFEDLEKSYLLSLDVPGLTRDQLDIGIEGDVVRVASKQHAPRKVKAAWRFPLEIDASASTAKLENGVLTLSLGKQLPVSKVTPLAIE
ncbi:MAG: heat shock protein Hsp20 [Polaromonas sp.]|jgi:HSP20 family protein|nr:heat shock protein Hsp20 [Polaromonas sp.]